MVEFLACLITRAVGSAGAGSAARMQERVLWCVGTGDRGREDGRCCTRKIVADTCRILVVEDALSPASIFLFTEYSIS